MQTSLFAKLPPKVEPLPRSILEMRRINGQAPEGVTCRKCAHLRRYRKAGRLVWMKCNRAYVTAMCATDWQASWPACGLYTEE